MDYKTIEELYLAIGVAGAIIVVFLGIFVYLIVSNNKYTISQMEDLVKETKNLQLNDNRFENLVLALTDVTKELANTVDKMSDTLIKVDYYNKNLFRNLEKHDDRVVKMSEDINALKTKIYHRAGE